ncbi:MAG: adenylate/guanylate cyclase domain-containing protein [Chloroflexota bacterium]
MACPVCGGENPVGAKFCKECGTRLAAACPSCGAPTLADAKFCNECGTVLGTAPAAPVNESRPPAPTTPPRAAAEPVAERRHVTVLFADLVGFTPFAEERDAEEVREVLTRYFDLARGIIDAYGGVVEKFIGDAVMAVWGAPIAQEDDAGRAVRTALDLVEAVRTLGPTIQARVGVLTGEAAVTIGATNQGMVAGDIVNTAARLQSVAAPGSVLVGEGTYQAASLSIAFEPAGEQALKGKTSPVPAWRALRVIGERDGRRLGEGLEPPFVGRDDELRLLKDLFQATSRERRARLVSILGPAGIGKSRLGWEFEKYLDGVVENVWWHSGRSPAYGTGISFWALGEMVRGRCRLVETDDEATSRSKIAQALAEHVQDADERRWIERAFLVLLGFESGMATEELYGAWRTFFERLAETSPVIMVFEDFHHADTGLVDFVDHVMEWSRAVPIFVVTLARPDLLDKRPAWGAGKRNFTSVYLEPLTTDAMRHLLRGLVPRMPESALASIVGRADGMPLYAVETVRMLIAEGRLGIEDGVCRPVGDLTNVAVPETLTALVASRLDALVPAERALVSDAAVLGQSFTLAALAAVSGIPDAELEPMLRQLVRRELLTQDLDPRSPERGQYSFVQALIREVAYNTLARRDRKVRHLAAARFFEAIGSDELAGALASHYLAAHENAGEPAEADALGRQARIALQAAADRAIALGSYEQALGFLQSALTVASDPREEADLLERAGRAATEAARLDEAEVLLRRSIDLRRGAGDTSGLAGSLVAISRTLVGGYRSEEAIALLEPAMEELKGIDDEVALVRLATAMTSAYAMHQDTEKALELIDRYVGRAERLDLVEAVVELLMRRGILLAQIGRSYEASALTRGALELAETHGLVGLALACRGNLGFYLNERDPAKAFAFDRETLAETRRLGMRRRMLLILGNTSEEARATGDWDWALGELAPQLAGELDRPDRAWFEGNTLVFRTWRGEATPEEWADWEATIVGHDDPQAASDYSDIRALRALAEGRLAEARRLAIESFTIVGGRPSRRAVAARAALWSGDRAGAAADLDAIDEVGVHGPAAELTRTTIRAGIAALDGRTTEAISLYRGTRDGWRDIGLPWEEALLGIDMASLLDSRESEVVAAVARSREILTGLRAKTFLDRLDALVARAATPETSVAAERPTQTADRAPV